MTGQDFDQSLQRYLAEAKGHITKMAIFAFVFFLLPTVPVLIKGQHLWLIVLPFAAAAFVGKGMQSVLHVKEQAVAVLKSGNASKMNLAALDKQFLWWNSESSPGYKVNLKSDSTDVNVTALKVDPANHAGVERMKDLLTKFELAKETNSAMPSVEADVYVDSSQKPVALLVEGELLWAAYWW